MVSGEKNGITQTPLCVVEDAVFVGVIGGERDQASVAIAIGARYKRHLHRGRV